MKKMILVVLSACLLAGLGVQTTHARGVTAAQLAANQQNMLQIMALLTPPPPPSMMARRASMARTTGTMGMADSLTSGTQAIINPFVPLVLGPNDRAILQVTYYDPVSGLGSVALNCYSNGLWELQWTADLTQPWVDVLELGNGQAYTFYATNSTSVGMGYFRARLIPDRWYIHYLNDPYNEPPVTSYVLPEKTLPFGYWVTMTNFVSAPVAVWTNWFLMPIYQSYMTNYPNQWQCAVITHYYTDSQGSNHLDTTPVYMAPYCVVKTFEINYVVNPGNQWQEAMPCGCDQFPFNLYSSMANPPSSAPPLCSPPMASPPSSAPPVGGPVTLGPSGGNYNGPNLDVTLSPDQNPPGTFGQVGQDPDNTGPDTGPGGPAWILGSPADNAYRQQCPSGGPYWFNNIKRLWHNYPWSPP